MITSKGNTDFLVQDRSGGYSTLFSQTYLGVSQHGRILLYNNDNGEQTRFYLEKPKSTSNQIHPIFEKGNKLKFKTNTGMYFYYSDKGSPISTYDSDLAIFTVEKNGDFYQFKNKNKIYMLTTQGNNLFDVNEHKNGYYTLCSGNKFLGVSNDNRVLIFNSDNGNETRFYPELIEQQKNYLINGNSITFKTNNGNYFYYNDSGSPIAGPYHKNSVFKVEQEGTLFKFKNPNGVYMLTTSGNTKFNVVKNINGYYTLFSGEYFLGVSSENKVMIYKSDTGKETRFYLN